MQLTLNQTLSELNARAAAHAAAVLRQAIASRGTARLVAATGSSQIDFLSVLTKAPDVDWTRVELFHLDEYIGIAPDHPASFCRFLTDRLVRPAGIRKAYLLDGSRESTRVMREIGAALSQTPADLLFAGVGENGHLAFNEPPADFETTQPYFEVALDDTSRRQQVGEGWFATLDEVPRTAMTMSVRQILTAREIVCLVHGQRKAAAVQACFGGEVSPMAPASILRTHACTTVFMDPAAASRLPRSRGGLAAD